MLSVAARHLIKRTYVDEPFFERLDLQRHIFRIDSHLGQTACDEPGAVLPSSLEHIPKFTILIFAPNLPDPLRNARI